jgi:hypothetical protein
MFIRLTDDLDLLDQADNPRLVEVFGVVIGDKPVDVGHLPEQHKATLKSNPFFVEADPLDHDGDGKKGGSKGRKAKASFIATVDPQRAEIIAQLEGLGVEFDPNADTEALEAALDAATAPDEA